MILTVLIKQEEQYKAAADERMKAALKEKQEEFNELLAQLVRILSSETDTMLPNVYSGRRTHGLLFFLFDLAGLRS